MSARRVVAVIAKAPVPGRAKTRLCPPCTPEQAAAIARASLEDTLDAVRAARPDRRVLVLDGAAGPWADGFEVVPQRGRGLDERLAAAFEDVGERAFLVGMDTPQLRPDHLEAGLAALDRADAAFGAAADGGYWGIGLRVPDPAVFVGVPMSEPTTGAAQLARLAERGLSVAHLDVLLDVDHFHEAREVAALVPGSRFAAAVAAVGVGAAA